MERTKAIGLLHKQVVKDSAISRMAIGDSIVTLRKPGKNDEPCTGVLETFYGDDRTDAELTDEAQQTWRQEPDDKGQVSTFAEHKSIKILAALRRTTLDRYRAIRCAFAPHGARRT